MPRNADDKPADLFGDEAIPQRRVANGQTRTHRPLLPEDIEGSLAILNEQDFERLRAAMEKEAARRGRKMSPNLGSTERERLTPTTDGITAARANLVRAAFKAGVKPLAIARQFGLSQAIVRELLKSR
ncbi:MAG: hypothetical protein ACJ8CX_20510 [Microvirga sp.]|jgi:hypothetical protein